MTGVDFNIENTTWWKTDGTDHFKVRSVIFDESGMQIQTYDGRMVRGDDLREYIQTEIPIEPQSKNIGTPKINKSLLLQGIDKADLDDVFPEDPIINTPGIGSSLNSDRTTNNPGNDNDIIIERMIKNLGYPEIEYDIQIHMDSEYIQKLKTSVSVMGLDIKDVKEYIMNNITDTEIRQVMNDKFSKVFDESFGISKESDKKAPPTEWIEDDSFNM